MKILPYQNVLKIKEILQHPFTGRLLSIVHPLKRNNATQEYRVSSWQGEKKVLI